MAIVAFNDNFHAVHNDNFHCVYAYFVIYYRQAVKVKSKYMFSRTKTPGDGASGVFSLFT